MISKSVYGALGAVVFIVSTAFTVDGFYQRKASAKETYEVLAADQEAGRLDNERQLIELELKMLESKPDKTDADKSRIEYLKQRRMLIEARLLDAAKKA